MTPMARARLHWFWRATIATVVACGYAGLSVTVLHGAHEDVASAIAWLLGDRNFTTQWGLGVGAIVAWFLPVLLIAFAVYGLLTRQLGHRTPMDGETRCRKCGYILRGITEPRCPECGERI